MTPVVLRSGGLVLDQPTEADIDAITRYCRDPLFERYLTTPWPYERRHAEGFVRELVPSGWESGREATWALRAASGADLLGVIGLRFERNDLGYCLGAEHRRGGLMTAAVRAVVDWAFDDAGIDGAVIDHVDWECVEGNLASAATARSAGFRFTGTAPSHLPSRDGSHPPGWHGIRHRDEDPSAALASWSALEPLRTGVTE